MKEISVNGYFCHDYFRKLAFSGKEIGKIAAFNNVGKMQAAIKEIYIKSALGIKRTINDNETVIVKTFTLEKGRRLLVLSFDKTASKLDCYAVGVVLENDKTVRYLTVELAVDPVEYFVEKTKRPKTNTPINIVGEWTKDGKHFNRGDVLAWDENVAALALIEEANKA